MADALIVEEILILADQPDDSVLVNEQEVVEVVTDAETRITVMLDQLG